MAAIHPPPLPRRAFLGSLVALGFARPARSEDRARGGIVALDWPSAHNLLALGLTPIAMPEIANYRDIAVEPIVPPQVKELGLRPEPNLELIASLAPDLLVGGRELSPIRDRLEELAPILDFDPGWAGDGDLIEEGRQAMSRLAERLGATDHVDTFLLALEAELETARERLRADGGRPVFVVMVLDTFRMLVFGKGSLFQAVLDHLGLNNAWDGATSRYGHAVITVDRLAARPEARLLCIGAGGQAMLATLLAAPAVASLALVRHGRFAMMENVLFYGGLPSARRFARLASIALTDGMAG